MRALTNLLTRSIDTTAYLRRESGHESDGALLAVIVAAWTAQRAEQRQEQWYTVGLLREHADRPLPARFSLHSGTASRGV